MPSIQAEASLAKSLGLWLLLMVGILILGVNGNALDISRQQLEIFTSLCWLFMLFLLGKALPKGIWSICFIYFASFSIFHAGLILADSLGGITDRDIRYQISFWFDTTQTLHAIHLVSLGMLGFALGALIFSSPEVPAQLRHDEENASRRIYHTGGILLTLSIIIFFAVTGLTGALSSYGTYLELLSQVPLLGVFYAYLYFFIGAGLVLVSAAYQKKRGYHYFLLFALWALFAFKLGLRGEVMFPLTVAACMLGRKGMTLGTGSLLLFILVFLIVSGVVKNARISGDYSQVQSINPMNAVAEMGSSLRPVQEVIKWHEQGDPLLLGASYWAPIERQIALLVPGMERLNAAQDKRLLNVVVQQRVGPIGFSPVAEAYLNFGRTGVILVLFLLGALLARLDNLPSSLDRDILLGMALIPLFIMIRNSFTHVPVQMVLGLLIGILVIFVTRRA
ncbi:O-antigen polysaccharide polymerase Wzy [Bowmanella dokdonensis]|uniref:O-antigen polysaccharide polymerase Wzy n=1 Tax=Bowmanella dokdonensis TaxID=751969 RepID=A0A939DM97_9ALTE|nr:O-antigen polysaccharide polymerase Wzy [Bowmanella dokdonensis]MBN7825083.1 O-antigen polysaccharide polymerase Wzy [Bowmanella dokdonensis]